MASSSQAPSSFSPSYKFQNKRYIGFAVIDIEPDRDTDPEDMFEPFRIVIRNALWNVKLTHPKHPEKSCQFTTLSKIINGRIICMIMSTGKFNNEELYMSIEMEALKLLDDGFKYRLTKALVNNAEEWRLWKKILKL